MFVTFEGPEGAGKSTALRTVADRMTQRGFAVTATREPGAGDFGQAVRRILLESAAMPPESELFLFLADRANHVRTVIEPALAARRVVLCDRYADSTYVYQAIARGLDSDFIKSANAFATGGRQPDLTFLFDLDPRIGLARIQNGDRLDREPIEFHQAVRAGFQKLAAGDPRWIVLNADASPEVLADEIAERLERAMTT